MISFMKFFFPPVFLLLFLTTTKSFSLSSPTRTGKSISPSVHMRSLSNHVDGTGSHTIIRKSLQLGMVSDPDPSILISNQNDYIQKIVFVSSFALLAAGTSLCIGLWHGLVIDWIGANLYESIRLKLFPIAFGLIFGIVGVLHFVYDTNFVRIVPPKGTWGGLWQVPAPGMDTLGCTYEEYHCYWSGVVEFIGGVWLFAAATELIPTSTEIPAFLLFLLTIGVTPANLYMFTHDAHPGGVIPKLDYPFGHIARFGVQCGLLSNFWIMFHG